MVKSPEKSCFILFNHINSASLMLPWALPRRLSDVLVPLLLVSAADDPMTTGWVPLETVRSNEQGTCGKNGKTIGNPMGNLEKP